MKEKCKQEKGMDKASFITSMAGYIRELGSKIKFRAMVPKKDPPTMRENGSRESGTAKVSLSSSNVLMRGNL